MRTPRDRSGLRGVLCPIFFSMLVGMAFPAPSAAQGAPGEPTTPTVAVVELHNASGETLPRSGPFSEDILIRHLSASRNLRVLSKSVVRSALLEAPFSGKITLVPYDPELAADLGSAVGADYVLSGAILEQRDGYLRIELSLVSTDSARVVLSESFEVEGLEPSRIAYRDGLDRLMAREGTWIEDRLLDTWDVEEVQIAERQAAQEAALQARLDAEEAERRRVQETEERRAEELHQAQVHRTQAETEALRAAAARDREETKALDRPTRIVVVEAPPGPGTTDPEPPDGPRRVSLHVNSVRLKEEAFRRSGDLDGEPDLLLLMSAVTPEPPNGRVHRLSQDDSRPVRPNHQGVIDVRSAGLSLELLSYREPVKVVLLVLDDDALRMSRQPGIVKAFLNAVRVSSSQPVGQVAGSVINSLAEVFQRDDVIAQFDFALDAESYPGGVIETFRSNTVEVEIEIRETLAPAKP